MTKAKSDLLELLEREIRAVLRAKDATRADKLKAIDAGARVAMIKHKISEATDGAAGAFFARDTRDFTAWGGPERALRRPASDVPAATNDAATEGGPTPESGGPEDFGPVNPPAAPPASTPT